MPSDLLPRTIADMPARKASAPLTPAQGRGRFFNTGIPTTTAAASKRSS